MIQDLNIEIQAIKKTETKGILEMKNLGKWSATTNTNTNNRIQEIEERIRGIENSIEEIDSLVKENVKFNKCLAQNIQEIWDTIKGQT